MQFGIEKCTMLVMKSGKRHMKKGVELPKSSCNQNARRKETYKELEILDADTIKQAEMKEKN